MALMMKDNASMFYISLIRSANPSVSDFDMLDFGTKSGKNEMTTLLDPNYSIEQ
jgi:hypothetical protein